MRRTIFTASLLSAMSCLCTQAYSQVSVQPVADQTLIGGAQTNITGQQLQNQSSAQVQGNVVNGVNAQAGVNAQTGRINPQLGTNAQTGMNNSNAVNAGVQQRGGQASQYQYLPNQPMQAWQIGAQAQTTVAGNRMPNTGMMAGMPSAGPVYLLQHESSGREFICVNGRRVYFDQPAVSQADRTNPLEPNTGAIQNQRTAGYGSYDQAPGLRQQQPAPVAAPELNQEPVAKPRNDLDAKPAVAPDKPIAPIAPSAVNEAGAAVETNNAKDLPTVR